MRNVCTLCLLTMGTVAAAADAASSSDPTFRELIDRQTMERLRQNPQALTSLGIDDAANPGEHSGKLTDTSIEALESLKKSFRRWRDELLAWDKGALGAREALTHEIAMRQYNGALARAQYPYVVDLTGRITYAIDHMYGPQTALPRFMVTRHRIGSAGDARQYVNRLNAFGAVFDGCLDRMRLQRDAGVIPPKFVIENVLYDARLFIDTAPAENPLAIHLAEELESVEGLDPETRAHVLGRATAAIENVVYPAFRRLIAAYEPMIDQAANHGVWALPDGLAYYDTMLQVETTTTLSADEIHELGLNEVARISREMDGILRDLGLTRGSVGKRVQRLGRDPKYLFTNNARGRAQLVAFLNEVLDDMRKRQQDFFGVLPEAEVVVRRVPPFAQASQTIAYYSSGSIDGSRPGVYFINLRDTRDMPRWSLPSLSYHESIPGHHLQIMRAREIEDLPLYRRTLGVTAFVEGWALYAERLAWEMGAYEDRPLGNLGRLQYEMWRAVRMVVDTGIHVKRWSKERAIDYFTAKTGMSAEDAKTEIERYFVTPGSAPAYKLGMMKILELRTRAREALGEHFDISAFHDAVLANGPLPLPVLDEVMSRWIAQQAVGRPP